MCGAKQPRHQQVPAAVVPCQQGCYVVTWWVKVRHNTGIVGWTEHVDEHVVVGPSHLFCVSNYIKLRYEIFDSAII
jgi:hypothetical protein